jgi:hypothetical protein
MKFLKRGREPKDPKRRLVQGILNLVLTTLATMLAKRLADLIMGKEEEPQPESE